MTAGSRRLQGLTRAWRDRGKEPLHFLHVGKTGGTAIKNVLRSTPASRYRVVLHPHRVRLVDLPAGEKVVLVVRDPVSRFVSGFNSRLRKGGDAHRKDWSPAEAAAFTAFPTAEQLALALGSEDHDVIEAAGAAMHAVSHLRQPQVAWVGDLATLRERQSDFLLVGRQWALDDDFARLADLIGLSVRNLPTGEAEAHRTPALFATTLSGNAAGNVRAWYAADYDFLTTLAELGDSVGFHGGLPDSMRR